MNKIILLCILFLGVIHTKSFSFGIEPFCINCNEPDQTADIYILSPDELQGQLLSGQFYKITRDKVKPEMTMEEIILF